MNPYTLDFSKYYSDITSVLKTIFGYKYSNIIDDRFNSIIFAPYSNYKGIKAYYEFLIDAKSRELCIKFLKLIGYEINNINYADRFTGEIEQLVNKYLEGYYAFKKPFQLCPDTFKAFFHEKSETYDKKTIIDNRIKFINNILNLNITNENIDAFSKTEKYEKLVLLCEKYNSIYTGLCDEMNEYIASIETYKNYYEDEEKRYNDILKKHLNNLFSNIKHSIPSKVKIDDINLVIGPKLDSKFLVEYFSKEDEEKLTNPSTPIYDKKFILYNRKKYFLNMGFISDINIDYYELIKRKDIKDIIPSFEFIEKIKREKEISIENANREFIFNSDDFKNIIKKFGNTRENKEYLYILLKNNMVCLHSAGINEKFVPVIFLTLRRGECGCFDYVILHEIIHAIESEGLESGNYRCGLEPQIFYGEDSKHIYLQPKRKYERMNEAITDIFAVEALEILHALDIYMFEPKELVKSNPGNTNTSILLKEPLKPFVEQYRELIIDARITGNIEELKLNIGSDNYEELNDIIDYIDTLIEMGLHNKIHNNELNDKLVIEYISMLKRLSILYSKMQENYDRYTKIKRK